MAQIKQYFDIKFPFTSNNVDGFFIDLNETIGDKVLSEILHDLIQYLQGKYPIKDNLDWLDDLGTFDYGKRTDIFNHLEYRTYSSLNKNRHYVNDNGLYL